MTRPLEGVRVVDFSQITSGPLGTMVMAEQGADVVKVEPLGIGDLMRATPITRNRLAAMFLNHNRGKRSIAVDLSSDEGLEVARDLVAGADVVVQNFRPGVADRIGIGYEAVRARNADVIYISISGFGPTGPYAGRPALDPVIQGLSGMVARQKSEVIPIPDLVRNILIDKATALTVAQSACAALFHRATTGHGDHIEIPMLDVGIYFFWPDGMADYTFLGDGVTPGPRITDLYQLTQCADGPIIYYAANNAQLRGVMRAVGHPELCDDPRFKNLEVLLTGDNLATLGGIFEHAFGELPAAQVLARLHEEDVPAGPILEPEQVFDDEQVLHNQTLVTWNHPVAGRVRQPRHPVRFASAETPVPERAPTLGEHTDAILRELGRSDERIAALRAAGVVQ